jgi:tetratricopeptide (TPR) repeat protein
MGIFQRFIRFRQIDSAAKQYKKGLQLGKQEKWPEAAAEFTKVLQKSPSLVQARYSRGCAYFQMKEWDQAILDFSAVIESKPHSVDALVNRVSAAVCKAVDLANRYYKSGGKQYQLTFEELNMPMGQLLRSISPEKGLWIRTNDAIMELQLSAKRDAEAALKLDPKNVPARQWLQNLARIWQDNPTKEG